MREIILKLLEEVDPDLKELMLKKDKAGDEYWYLLNSPVLTILEWQKLRDDKSGYFLNNPRSIKVKFGDMV